MKKTLLTLALFLGVVTTGVVQAEESWTEGGGFSIGSEITWQEAGILNIT